MDSKIFQYAVLLLEMFVAWIIAAPLACGVALMAKQPVAWSIGAGLVMGGVALLATFQASPNSKGLIISLPQQAAEQKLDTPTTTIERK